MLIMLLFLMLVGPRGILFLWWLFEPARWSLAFPGGFLAPLLGFIFVPWTTMTYVFVSPQGISTADWLFLGLAFLVDLASIAGGGVFGRRRATSAAY